VYRVSSVILVGAVILCFVSAAVSTAAGQNSVAALRPEKDASWPDPARTDWLIDPEPFEAGVFRSRAAEGGGGGDEIVLSNGLIRRTLRLGPNVATVGLDNLMTGDALLRGVKPEARVTIDGIEFEVGGLKGQKNYAFVRPEWVDRLTADPAAFRLVRFEVGAPAERLAWKRVRHHAPDAAWPPRGVWLRMDYRLPEEAVIKKSVAPQPSASGRRLLIADAFEELSREWSVHVSDAHPRGSFENEGKAGEIYTPANTAVFAQRSLPPETRVVEAVIDTGTDRSASWGPGIALVWEGRVVKFNLRPGGDGYDGAAMFGLFDGRRENPRAGGRIKLDLSRPWRLRLRIEGNVLFCEAKPRAGSWKTYATVPLESELGPPRAVRVGKLDRTGGAGDHSAPGDLVRLRVIEFAAYSGLEKEALAALEREMAELRKITLSVHYELYDGIPLLSKWISLHNGSDREVRLDRFTSEILAAVEYGSAVEDRGIRFSPPNIHVETDYSFSGMTAANTSRFSVHWVSDPDYSTQVNYLRRNPCLLEVRPTVGPARTVPPGESFESFRAFILLRDSTDRERNGLAQRRMYRTIAPWVTENPLMMHVRFADWKTVKNAIDQCAAVGFEMVILTFGSGFNIENDSPDYIAEMKRYADYAGAKGIEIGGYSLLASRRVGGGHDVVMPPGERPTFGNSPCLHSGWGQEYFGKLYAFYEKTGFRLLEHDGSYPGDVCIADHHPGHRGFDDSRWNQWRKISDFYKWCRGSGIYLNVPDYYYLAGSTKCGMGYREVNWSLPRDEQVIHTRQNIFDGTWQKTPSMGWMFVPLTQYHGGGAAATIEPLDEHRDHYERMLYSNLALGVQACYRGPRLFDTDRTRDLVKKWVDWYRKYRAILESDMIHGRRADARGIDWMLHVNPRLETKGMLVLFNPLAEPVDETVRVDLYYTGLTDTARVREQEGGYRSYTLDRKYRIDVPVKMAARSMTWFVIE